MLISYDPAKRDETLARRGLDLADAGIVLSGPALTAEDDRFDYGEPRFITIGLLRARMVVVAWTPRGDTYRIISMRKANDREVTRYGPALRHHSG
jgi:uncharacterized protein